MRVYVHVFFITKTSKKGIRRKVNFSGEIVDGKIYRLSIIYIFSYYSTDIFK